jgi:hypothetical protein
MTPKKKLTQTQVNEVFMASAEYKEIKKEVEGVKKEMTKLCGKVDKIHNALLGDRTLQQDGLAKMVKKHEDWIQKQNIRDAKIYGAMVVITTMTSLLVKFWDKIF